jgi:hypothetical protein
MGGNEEFFRDADESADDGSAEFKQQLTRSLKETETGAAAKGAGVQGWHKARCIVEEFKPVPWVIWRLANFSLGQSGKINRVYDGMAFGLKELLCAAARDETLAGATTPRRIENAREALAVLSGDVAAAVSVMYAVNRRLKKQKYERIWRPILDDAILRAQIGYFAGSYRDSFGPGRGMLAGYAGRIGLAVLIATGEFAQAQKALELLAAGKVLSEVGEEVYACDPLQVSSMILSAAGCGRDAAFGTVAYASREPDELANDHQRAWLSAFVITEHLRTGTADEIDDRLWGLLNIDARDERGTLCTTAEELVKHGHTWKWLE